MEANMRKTDFGFTYAQNDEDKAKLILDAIKESGSEGLKYAIMFEPLNLWVHTTDKLYITVGDLPKIKVSQYDSGSIYLEKEDEPIND